jgi:hypothetical protein
MYIEYTPQGFNIIGLSAETLTEIIRAFRRSCLPEEHPEFSLLVQEAEKELILNS